MKKKRIEEKGGEVGQLEDEDDPYRVFSKDQQYPGIAMNRSIGIILSNYFFDKTDEINWIDIKYYFTNKCQNCSFIKSNNIFISLISINDINQSNISCINLG